MLNMTVITRKSRIIRCFRICCHRSSNVKSLRAFDWLLSCSSIITVVMRGSCHQVNSLSCIGVLPFIEGYLGGGTSGLVAVSHDSEEHA